MTEEIKEDMVEVKEPKPKKAPKKKSYFNERELRCRHTGECKFDDEFLDLLNKIRKECDFPFKVTSAYRHPSHPNESRKQATGAHCTGKAIDIAVSGQQAIELVSVAIANGITRIGVQQKGTSRFIHLDICTKEDFPDRDYFPEEAIWSY